MSDAPGRRPRFHRLLDLEELATPALILDLPKVRANIEEMRRRMETVPAALRPHAKIHKSPVLGQMQIDAGAIGLTTATVWEATAMIEAGIGDIFVANQVVGDRKVAELARLGTIGSPIVAVDDAGNAELISVRRMRPGERSGSWSRSTSVCTVPACAESSPRPSSRSWSRGLPGLRLRGPFGYEGHCMLEPDREERVRKAKAANAHLLELVDEMERRGLSTEIVAAGGLGTWDITGANPRITEIHAGSYIFSDAFHRNLVPGFDPALTVLSRIISRHGEMAVLDSGRKSIGIDRVPPELVGVAGAVRFEHGEHFIHEEHIGVELEDAELGVGDTVQLMPGYSPTTVNFYDCFFVVEDGLVIDVWPVLGRYGTETTGTAP